MIGRGPTDLWSPIESTNQVLRDFVLGRIRGGAKITYFQYISRLIDLRFISIMILVFDRIALQECYPVSGQRAGDCIFEVGPDRGTVAAHTL